MDTSKKKEHSKVSMIMPFYNKRREELEIMLQSIHDQVWDNIELIVVNDGSTDGSRNILEEWRSKFASRGYSYIVIDQENQGISAAVRNGMLHMTGDYFCSVDCDDYLYPEYVSTMASWLDERPDYEYAACGFERIIKNGDETETFHCDDGNPVSLASPNLTENILLYRVNHNSWNYLIRASYIRRCKIVENFVVEPRLYQEPSIIIPLSMGGGKLKYFPEVLYRHFLIDRKSMEERFPGYRENLLQILRQSINTFPECQERKRIRLLSICELTRVLIAFKFELNISLSEAEDTVWVRSAAALANELFYPSPEVSERDILLTGYRPFFNALGDCLTHVRRPSILNRLNSFANRKKVYYGVLGSNGKSIIPPLINTPFKPDLLWDRAAEPNSEVCGEKVFPPNFGSLCDDDILVIIPSRPSLYEEIQELVDSVYKIECVQYKDLLRYVEEFYYPYFTNCEINYRNEV